MTRLYLISGIVVGAILLQALVTRPPEIIWKEADSQKKDDSTMNKSSNLDRQQETPVEVSAPKTEDIQVLARRALENAANMTVPAQSSTKSKTVSYSTGTRLEVHNSQIQNGKLQVTLDGGTQVNIPIESISKIDPIETAKPETTDQIQQLLNRIHAGQTISDEEIQRWIESGEAEDFALRFPHSSNRDLIQKLAPVNQQKKISQNKAPPTINENDLDGWLSSIQDRISRNISSSQRTQLILEIDSKLAALQNSRNLTGNREKADRWSNRLRILKLDLIKGTGF